MVKDLRAETQEIRVIRRRDGQLGTAMFDAVQHAASISLLVQWDDGTSTVYASLSYADKCVRPAYSEG